MLFKFNAAQRHRVARARYRVTNWPVYEAGLRRRGDLTLWLDQVALAGWAAPKRSTPGGQPRYSDVAVDLVLTLRLVFHLVLRRAGAFARSVLALLGLGLCAPDHTTLSRRGRTVPDGNRAFGQAAVRFTSCWTAPGWSCLGKVSGVGPSMAGPVGAG